MRCLQMILLLGPVLCFAQINPPPPVFTAETIVNAASGLNDSFSPYGAMTIHGANLALQSQVLRYDNLPQVPTAVGNGGTKVWIRNVPAGLLYVSKEQLVVLPSPELLPGPASVVVAVASLASAPAQIVLRRFSPAFYLQAEGLASANRIDSEIPVAPDTPAMPGESLVLYAAGLGPTKPAVSGFVVLQRMAPVASPMRLLLDGAELPASYLDYAGAYPSLGGVYQVRFTLPPDAGPNPEIRIDIDGILSPEGVRLPVQLPVIEQQAGQRASSRKLARSVSDMAGSPGATWSSLPRRIQLSSSSTRE